MKIITRAVLDWDGNVLEEESFDYCGPIAACKDSGSPPAPVDPYTQASAQYGLDTGTANYNAALNRTNSSNPLGSNTWNITGYDGSGVGGIPGTGSNVYGFGGGAPSMSTGTQGTPQFNGVPTGIAGQAAGMTYGLGGSPGSVRPTLSGGPGMSAPGAPGASGGTGAPRYSQTTSLTPWANNMLASPLDTSHIVGVPGGATPYAAPGMPGGPDLTGSLNSTRNAMYDQSMAYLKPQQDLQNEQSDSQLANEGIMPGSAAYTQAKGDLGRQQTFANQQAVDSAIGAGNQEQATLYGLGTQSLNNEMNVGNSSLQNQIALRNAPISEYEALQGNPSTGVNAATPDISGAFQQQQNANLAGYNANVASNNATTGTIGSLAAMAAIYF